MTGLDPKPHPSDEPRSARSWLVNTACVISTLVVLIVVLLSNTNVEPGLWPGATSTVTVFPRSVDCQPPKVVNAPRMDC